MDVYFNNVKFQLVETLNTHSSAGQLKKWVLTDPSGTVYYAKSASHISKFHYGYECESECIVSRLAIMLGAKAILYDKGILSIRKKNYNVCLSKDYSMGREVVAIADLIPGVSKYHGFEKYKLVEKLIGSYKTDLDNMLLIDYIVDNYDRHLNNIEVYMENGNIIGLVPIYDSGAGLFSNKTLQNLKLYTRLTPSYMPCKPFFPTFGQQNALISMSNLQPIKLADVYKLVNFYLSGERAKIIGRWLRDRLKECNLLIVDRR